MNSHRTTVAVPYRASVTPRGARNARIEAFRLDVPVEFEVLERAPPVAVQTRDAFGNEVSYLGHAGALFLPVLSDWPFSSPPLPAEEVLRHFERGSVFRAQCEAPNPFAAVDRHRMLDLNISAFTGRIEGAALRAVHWDEGAQAAAAAQRIAGEFVLTGDGRILRRSPGPVWTCRTADRVDLLLLAHEYGARAPMTFSCTRREEATRWFAAEMGWRTARVAGTLDILLPEHVADHDSELAARAVLQRGMAAWVKMVAPLASPSVAALAKEAALGFERLHGMDLETLGNKRTQEWSRPVEALPLLQPEILEAVESFRLFVAEMPGDIDDPEVQEVCSNWRSVFEDLAGRALRRFDQFERPRLEGLDDMPDLGPVPSCAPSI